MALFWGFVPDGWCLGGDWCPPEIGLIAHLYDLKDFWMFWGLVKLVEFGPIFRRMELKSGCSKAYFNLTSPQTPYKPYGGV